MADPPRAPTPVSNGGTKDDARVTRDRGLPTGAPRWVKVFGVIVVVLVLVFVILHLTGGGFGGHAR